MGITVGISIGCKQIFAAEFLTRVRKCPKVSVFVSFWDVTSKVFEPVKEWPNLNVRKFKNCCKGAMFKALLLKLQKMFLGSTGFLITWLVIPLLKHLQLQLHNQGD